MSTHIGTGPSEPPRPGPAPVPSKIRVLIADDHAVVRQGLRTLLDLQDDMTVVGEAANGLEAVEAARQLQPDVVLIDLVMPRMDGVEATATIVAARPSTRVLVLTSFGEDDKVFPAIRAGAQGYLLKDVDPKHLIQAVRDTFEGRTQLHPDIAKKLMSAIAGTSGAGSRSEPGRDGQSLTDREQEVLALIAEGNNNAQIAARLVISEKTVKTHVSSILAKLGLEDRTQAAIWALKHRADA